MKGKENIRPMMLPLAPCQVSAVWGCVYNQEVNEVVVSAVPLGWPTVPKWRRDSAASPLHALAISHSLCTCRETGGNKGN